MVLAAKLVGVAGGPRVLRDRGHRALLRGRERPTSSRSSAACSSSPSPVCSLSASNVARIWREQAEGEKARNDDLDSQIKGMRVTIDELRDDKAALANDVAEAKRGDQSAVIELLGRQHKELIELLGHQHAEVLAVLRRAA